MKKIVLLTCLIVAGLVACRDRHNPYENKLNLAPSYLAQIDVANYTTIEWLDTLKDFGTLHEGDSVKLSFRFKNTGKKPLFLSNVKTSCGCTVTSFPEKPIFPGEDDVLVAVFKSEGHPGATRKGISVTSNTNNGTNHLLYFTGTVIPATPAKKL